LSKINNFKTYIFKEYKRRPGVKITPGFILFPWALLLPVPKGDFPH